MRRFWILGLLLGLGCTSMVRGQAPSEAGGRVLGGQRAATGVTRAVVIGISEYAAPGIRDLQFAHRDARAFADFLQSEAGGAVPADQLRILLNAEATLAAVDEALYWLRTQSEPGDRAILYFAGHGDVETEAHWQFGYLLTHDSPANNFRNNAVRVEDLDILAIELSSVREVKTVFYIDACRSGTLAEGRQVPHAHLAKQRANEVRILSCQPDQKSLEGPQWGGGRGAFSWHLIRGLQGLAMDPSIPREEMQVTVEELEEFLKGTLVRETRDLDPEKRQDPIVAGPRAFPLARVVPDILAAAKAGIDLQAPEFAVLASRSLRPEEEAEVRAASPLADLFARMQAGDVWRQMDLPAFRDIPTEDLPGVLFRSIRAEAFAYDLHPFDAQGLGEAAARASATLSDSIGRAQAARQLAVALHNAGQVLINRYLSADPGELAERSYHHFRHARYQRDPELFRLALNLLPEDHPLHSRVAVKAAYFQGLSHRVQAFFAEDAEAGYREALELQLQALALDDKAPYVHNELGILYHLTGQQDLAERHFRTAADLAPTWGLPLANLCAMFTEQQRLDEAWQMAEKGLGLKQPSYLLHYHVARLYQQAGNLLQAEDHYHQAIRLDTAHFAGYARLGELYLNTSEYALADQATEMALKKGMSSIPVPMGQDFVHPPELLRGDHYDLAGESPQPYRDRIARDSGDVEAHFKLATIYWSLDRPKEAEYHFRRVAALDESYPWLWDEFAWFLHTRGRHPEAWRAMEKAPEQPDFAAQQQALRALILEHLGRSLEAAAIYRGLLAGNPRMHALRPRLWKICESHGQWAEAEMQMYAFEAVDRRIGEQMRLDFYRRMQERFPDEREWLRRQIAILNTRCLSFAMAYRVRQDPADRNTGSVVAFYRKVLDQHGFTVREDFQPWTDLCGESEAILRQLLAGATEPEEKADWLRQLARIRERDQDKERAWALREEVLVLEPSDFSTQEKLARDYQEAGRTALARDHFAELHKQGALRYPDHYTLARAYTHAWDFSPASWLLREAETQSLEPGVTFQNREMRSRARLIAGDWAEAWTVYQELHREFPQSSEICYTLARLALRLEQPDQAWAWLGRALENGFREYFVLSHDPLTAPLRQQEAWQELVRKYRLEFPG